MLLTLRADHKKHILFLLEQAPQVLQDFCKLSLDYIEKGPNVKLYTAAAQKLEVTPDVIRNSVEGLVNVLLESTKYKLSSKDFQDSIVALGFSGDKEIILCKLYEAKRDEISKVLSEIGFKLPEYYNMEWRFEVQVASRSLLKQIAPLITMDLSLKNLDNPKEVDHVLFQTDPTNLSHMIETLEEALQEGRNQHIRRVSKAIK